MPRLFTGLEIPAEIAAELSQHRGGLPGARWVDPANYHITLRFIGDIDQATARDLTLLLSESRPRQPITIVLDALSSLVRSGLLPPVHSSSTVIRPSASWFSMEPIIIRS